MARRQKANPGLAFADRNNVTDPMDDPNDSDDSDDETYINNDSDDDGDYWSDSENDGDVDPSGDDSVDESEDDDDDTGVSNDDDDIVGDPEEVDNNDTDGDRSHNVDANVTDGDEDDDHGDNDNVQQDFNVDVDDANDSTEPEEETGVDPAPNDETGKETGVIDAPVHAIQGVDATDMDERYGCRMGRYNLRRRKEQSFTYLKGFTHANIGAVHTNAGVNDNDGSLATAQMSMKKGLKMFGKGGIEAVHGEMQQLHDRKVMEPRHARDLTPKELREALGYLMFLKRKRCGKIKGRSCADGRKQRPHINHADAASPTVATESVFLTAVIDVLEN
jgi:hypothetical protein